MYCLPSNLNTVDFFWEDTKQEKDTGSIFCEIVSVSITLGGVTVIVAEDTNLRGRRFEP